MYIYSKIKPDPESQDATRLAYITLSGELSIPDQDPPIPPASPSQTIRREQARWEEVAAARLRAEKAREQAELAWEEADVAQTA